jgi:hypothetical protein
MGGSYNVQRRADTTEVSFKLAVIATDTTKPVVPMACDLALDPTLLGQ